jgi:DNA-directed RNA polymerase beta subunit/DNA-directed RNA polymerase beta' subunit
MAVFDQTQSTQKVHDKVIQIFKDRFPYEANGYTVDVKDINFEMPDVGLEAQENAFANNETVEEIIRGTLTVEKGTDKKEFKNIVFSRVPAVTDRGTYILNGNENVFLNQMKLRPGIFVHRTEQDKETGATLKSEVRFGKRRAVITFDTKKASLKIDGLKMGHWGDTKTVDVLSLLSAIGASDAEIKAAVRDDGIFDSLKRHQKAQSPKGLLSALGGEVVETDDEAKNEIKTYLERDVTFDKRAKQVSEQVIGKGFDSFNKDAILATITQMFKEYKRPNSTPSVDDIRFKQVDSGEDMITIGVENGIDAWTNRIKRSLKNGNFKFGDIATHIKPKDEIYKGTSQMYNSNLCQFVDSPNPLDLQQKKQQLTLLGLDGLTKRTAKDQNRELQDTGFAKIDPVETPQSLSMGLIQHLARDAEIKDGKIFSKFYRVNNGVVDTSKTVDDIDPLDEFEEYIAFNNPEYVEKKDGTTSITKNEVRVRHKGKFETVSKDKVTLMDKSPTSHLGYATNLIPFGAHNDGARMLMGGSMQRQALPLEDPDVPLVQSVSGDKTIEEEIADNSSHLLRSPVSGEVTQIGDDFIKIKEDDGHETKVKKLNYFSTGKAGGYINHKPVVNVGDKVGVNDLLADGWQSKKGSLALGKNTLVAYMPYEGYNFEDGVVVSESFANKMVSEEVKLIEFETDENVITGKVAREKLQELGVSRGILDKLDENGIVKRTEKISAGDVLIAAVKEKPQAGNDAEGLVAKFLEMSMVDTATTRYSDRSKRAAGYQKGKIIDVKVLPQGDGKTKYVIKLLSFKPMGEGDKLSGRHGNKGTITKILPDSEMPHTEDGKPVELIFSPLAVPSRKNLGQLLEVNAGAVATKKGLPSYKVNNFDKKEKDRLLKEMEDLGMADGKQTLINPSTGKPFENKVTVGPMYIMKLKHKVEGKITSRSTWQDDKMTHQPKKVSGSIDGERRNPQSIGAMEFWSLTSAGAVHNIHEMNTLKSDGAGDYKGRMQIYNAIRNGEKIKEPVTPETMKIFSDKLYGIGIRMVPLKDGDPTDLEHQFNSLMLKPIGSGAKEADGMGVVNSPKTLSAKKKKFEKGGLYDEDVFGADGDQWGKIQLKQPVPNPMYMTDGQGPPVYAAMLASKGISNKDIRNVINNGHFIITNPGDSELSKYEVISSNDYERLLYIDKKHVVGETGATALNELLKDVDLKKEFTFAEDKLKNAKRLQDRSKAQRDYEIIAAALDNNMKPQDYLLDFIPVLPVKYREPVKSPDGMSMTDDGITKLYQRYLNSKTQADKSLDQLQQAGADMSFLPPEYQSAIDRNTATSLTQIFGTTSKPYVDPVRKQEFNGILHTLKSKHGFIRGKMQSKTQDYSGRSVIIVDPELGMDEVTIPEDMAAEMFKPQLIGKLMNDGLDSSQAKTAIKTRNDSYQGALKRIINEKPPVILNRQPSLHRHSLQAFIPKIRWNEDGASSRAIGLNPMVTSGFNADFDGDTMAVYVPITEKAKQEAKEKLLPSKNLLNPTNNRLIMELKHEMQLGIYYMTRDKIPSGSPKKFKNYADLQKAYEKGDVTTYDAVQMQVMNKGIVTATAGKHLFNLCLPVGYQNYKENENLNEEKLTALLDKMIKDPKVGPMKTSLTMNKLQKLSFKASTISSISIGVKDFDPVSKVDKGKLFEEAATNQDVLDKTEKAVANFIDRREAFEQAKTDFVQDTIKNEVKNLFDADNPVEIMRNSGARGNAGQITAMAGIVGVGKKVGGERTRSVNSSLLEGLSPDEFWDQADDSRKGIYDRSVATAEPGALSRRVWMSNKQTIITEHDCGTTHGITLNMNLDSDRRNLRGRMLLKAVQIKDEHGMSTIQPSKKQPLTEAQAAKIEVSATNKSIEVRSPMTCESTKGVCQVCYGSKPGAMQAELVPIGEAVGSVAGQAIGEPSTQAIMKTFHVGSSGSNLGNAFKQIDQVLKVPETMVNQAVIVEKDGVVKDITKDPLKGWVITIDRKKYQLNNKPKNEQIKVGMKVQAGEALTQEWGADGEQVTFRNPRDVIKYQGVDAAKEYMLTSINKAFEAGGIKGTDRRHYEVAVSNMFNTGVVRGGGTSKMNPGQQVPMKAVQEYNKGKREIVTAALDYGNKINVVGSKSAVEYTEKGSLINKKIIVRENEVITDDIWEKLRKEGRKFIKVYKQRVNAEQGIQGIEAQRYKSDNNWFDSTGSSHASQVLAEASGRMLVDKLDNPLSRQMAGLQGNFGTEFEKFKNTVQNKYSDFV